MATPDEVVHRLLDAIDLAKASGDLDRVNRLQAALWLDGALADEGRVGGQARELFLAMNGIALAAPVLGRVCEPNPAWDRLDRIAAPVRILCGDLDIPHIQARSRRLAAALPDARLEIPPGAAHLPSLEQPDRLTGRLLELLADCQRV
jgi:pimeloyl-ACP methyl ester carboxylesterase